jgi:hypothetical protein
MSPIQNPSLRLIPQLELTESTDYAQREYGATPKQVAALEKATDRRYRTLKRSGKLVTVTAEQLRKTLD